MEKKIRAFRDAMGTLYVDEVNNQLYCFRGLASATIDMPLVYRLALIKAKEIPDKDERYDMMCKVEDAADADMAIWEALYTAYVEGR